VIAGPCCGGSGEQDGIVTDTVSSALLAQPEAAAENGVVGGSRCFARSEWPQFMRETGVCEEPACFIDTIVVDQNAARQYTERAFEHAHVLVQHHVRDARAIKQGADSGHQHRVVGTNNFTHAIDPSTLPPFVAGGALREIG
jgi:hypothetical protein